MVKYAYVKNDVVEKVKFSLPISFEGVSNFYLLPEQDRNSYGWYNVVEDATIINHSQIVSETNYTYSNGVVTEVKTIVNKSVDDYKAELIVLLKNIFGIKINDAYPDYEQRLAGLNLLPANYTANMKSDIQVLLNKFNEYKEYINNASDLETLLTYKGYIDTWFTG